MRIIAVWRRRNFGRCDIGLPLPVQQVLLKLILAAVSSLLPLSGLERLPPSRIVWIEISRVHARLTFIITVGSQLLGQAVNNLTGPP
ncbi:hypothetical protein GCM10007880_64490 [Mesorhizobium amorphae]|nr:hypothetical protein GCM10007880_64490 [Mesorhizobium amorphae]